MSEKPTIYDETVRLEQCKHRLTKDDEEPCRTCDHNSNAVEDNAEEGLTDDT